jgi:hypothetical protein
MVVTPSVQEVNAHDSPDNCVGVYYGNYPNTTQRGVACTHQNHDWLDGCDRRADGLSARAWQYTPFGDAFPGSWDDNGANPGCANNYVGGFINSHRICVEQPVGCSGWRGS